MSSTPVIPSPLKTMHMAKRKIQQHHGWEGCLPVGDPGDGSGFPYGGFWEVEGYYQLSRSLTIEASAPTSANAEGSVCEVFDPPLVLPADTYYLCEAVEDRPMCSDDDFVSTGLFVTLRALHPVDQRIVRVRIWPHSMSGFSSVENAMEVIALAATGLTL